LYIFVFLVVSFLLAFPPISYMHSSSPPFVLHALPISSFFTWSSWLYLEKSTSYEAPHYAVIVPRLLVIFRNKLIFYGEELLAPHPTPMMEDHPLSAVRDCLFNIFAASLHTWRASPPSATWGRAMPWW
jgi:hypothetical protein